MIKDNTPSANELSRRRLLRQAVATGAGIGAFSFGGPGNIQFIPTALAADQPPMKWNESRKRAALGLAS